MHAALSVCLLSPFRSQILIHGELIDHHRLLPALLFPSYPARQHTQPESCKLQAPSSRLPAERFFSFALARVYLGSLPIEIRTRLPQARVAAGPLPALLPPSPSFLARLQVPCVSPPTIKETCCTYRSAFVFLGSNIFLLDRQMRL